MKIRVLIINIACLCVYGVYFIFSDSQSFFVNLKFNRWFSDLLLKAFLYVHKSWQEDCHSETPL